MHFKVSRENILDIRGIDDRHCLEVIVCFFDIGGIDGHHSLNITWGLVILPLATLKIKRDQSLKN
jgi:hypothetical protein